MTNNILEKDIEAAIHDGQLLMKYGIKIVGRQVGSFRHIGNCADFYHDFGGIVDLIGYHVRSKSWVIIELKRGVLDASAFTQLSRYMSSASSVAHDYFCDRMGRRPKVVGLLIGSTKSRDLSFISDLDEQSMIIDDQEVFDRWEFDDGSISSLEFYAEVKLEVSI